MRVSAHSIFNKPANTAVMTTHYVQESVLPKLHKLSSDLSTLMKFRNDGSNLNEVALENLTRAIETINTIMYPELENQNQAGSDNTPSF